MKVLKVLKILLVLALIGSLLACASGRRERAEPPRVSLQSLKVDGTAVSMQLRVTNQSFGPMVFKRLTMDLTVAGVVAAKGQPIELNALRVPGLGTEVVSYAVNNAELAAATNRAKITYRLSGQALSEEGQFPFELDSILNQVPGSPGEFR